MPSSYCEWLALIPSFGAILLTGLVIKCLDDYLDQDSNNPLLTSLGRGGIVYFILGILIAAALDFSLVFILFSASYIVGMFLDMTIKLPSGLPSWLESIIVAIVSIISAGLINTFWAIMIMFSIQLLDDLLDYQNDLINQQTNYAIILGIERTVILFLLSMYISLALQPLLSVVLLCTALFISEALCKNLGRTENVSFKQS